MHEAKALGITDFEASDGHWRWCHCVTKKVRLKREAGDVDLPAAERPMQQIRDSQRGYLPANVFNKDGQGCFIEQLPTSPI